MVFFLNLEALFKLIFIRFPYSDLTFAFVVQENRIEPQRYYELFERDTIKFGNSR